MSKLRNFLKRKDIIFSGKRYGIDALGAMAQGLFCTLLVGTILNTIGQQFHIGFLNEIIVTLGKGEGQNYWCMLYPALCTEPAKGEQIKIAAATFDKEEYLLVTDSGYAVKFRTLEILSHIFGK
jgi:hypothetical protein